MWQKGQKKGNRGGEDKRVIQAWRTDGFLSDVIIRLLALCS